VHDLAIIDKSVSLRNEVQIGPYATIKDNVKIGTDIIISSHALVRSHIIIGDGHFVDSFAVIDGPQEEKSFDTVIPSGVIVGQNMILRESITIHRSTHEAGKIKLGQKCFIGGGDAVHPNIVVGDYVILSENSKTLLDLSPYVMAAEVFTPSH
jgi:UDP-N-acetylglucosamine acyltransferase